MTVSAQSAEVGEVSAEITVLEGSQPGRMPLNAATCWITWPGKPA